jgi:hypothetical protein
MCQLIHIILNNYLSYNRAMKYLILMLIMIGFSGCTTMSYLLEGAGNGLQNANRGSVHCTSYHYGNYTNTNCR